MATIELRDLNPAEFDNNLIVYGRLGVGTDSPTANLHIVDSSDPVLKIQNTSANPANGGTIHFIESGGTDGFKIHHDGNENRLEFQFESSGSETTFMTLKRDTGYVGIGTTSPDVNLHIQDTVLDNVETKLAATSTMSAAGTQLRLENLGDGGATTNVGCSIIFENHGNRSVGAIASHHEGTNKDTSALSFWTHSSDSDAKERMRISQLGKVGIGTTSPANLLHVLGNSANGEIKAERASGAVSLIQAQASLVRFGTTSNHNLHLISNDNTKVTITTAGRLGIGTTSPSTKLHVIGDTTVNNTSSNAVINLTSDSNSSILNFTNSNEGAVLRSDTYIRIDTNGSNERIRVLSDGKLGIGTDSPTARLHVDNTAGGDDIKFETSTDHDLNLVLEAGTANNQFSLRIPDEIDRLEFMSDSNIRMTLLDNGNVGINETSPTEKLHVDGNLKVTGDVLIGSTATSITEVGPYDPYVLYHWTGRQYQNGGSSDIMYFNGDALYYADADSPWNKSSVAAANPESLTTLVGGATFNRTYQTRNWEWHYMIRLDNTTKTDSALPTKYMRIKMPVYYTAGASEHHVFYFQVLNNDDYQSGFQLCVCDSSGNPVKRAAVQHKNGGGWATYGSYQRGPNNSVANQSTGKYGEWTNSLIMGGHIDSYSFADSDSPTGRSIYLSINCSTANSNNYIWFMGFAIGKNKKGIAITTPRIIVNGANDPARGKVNLYGNGLRHHNNWHWSEMAFVHQQHASTTPIQIAGTDKDIIINFMNTGHSDHEFDKVTLFLTDKDSNQRYDGSGGGNFGWDSHVPNQWVNAGLMNIGSFTGNGADKWLGYSHRGGISLSWIIKKQLLQELAYDVDGITNLRVGFGNVNNHWRHGYIRGIATEQINS